MKNFSNLFSRRNNSLIWSLHLGGKLAYMKGGSESNARSKFGEPYSQSPHDDMLGSIRIYNLEGIFIDENDDEGKKDFPSKLSKNAVEKKKLENRFSVLTGSTQDSSVW